MKSVVGMAASVYLFHPGFAHPLMRHEDGQLGERGNSRQR